MINNVTISGNTTRDCELRFSQSGTAVGSFSVAVQRKFKKDEADFINVVCFKKLAELVAENIKKGTPVVVSGRLQTRSWEKDGRKHYATDVVAEDIQWFNRSNGDPFKDDGQPIEINDNDLPF